MDISVIKNLGKWIKVRMNIEKRTEKSEIILCV